MKALAQVALQAADGAPPSNSCARTRVIVRRFRGGLCQIGGVILPKTSPPAWTGAKGRLPRFVRRADRQPAPLLAMLAPRSGSQPGELLIACAPSVDQPGC